jgi:hypothetical protein
MSQEYIEETVEEPQECESGLEEYMREYAARQFLLIRHEEFQDKRCPVVLH